MSIENRFSGNVTLKELKNRILLDKKLLAQHPECKELLERRIANTEKLILDCICNCKNNKLLNEISIKSRFC